jgi:serine/threonine-protein kinase
MLQGSDLEQPPLTVGKYRVIAKLGEGGMAHVFLAVSHGPVGFSKLAVLKVVRPQLAEDPEILSMFLDEARLAGRLNHANVVQTYEVGEEDGRYVLVMEYLEGQPLRALQRRTRERGLSIPLPLQLKILVDALSGLHYAHELRDFDGTPLHLVHRDVSPHNIFVTYDGQVKVLDFGIAKAATSSQETKSGVIKGKVSYMAPEQFQSGIVDRRADIYSMGAILWQTATGRRLWRGEPEAKVLFAVANGEIPRPSDVQSGVPAELERICMRALAVDPSHRYPTAEHLQKDLRALASELSTAVSALELGAFVAREFATERRHLRERIEQQLSRTEAGTGVSLLNLHTPLLATGSSVPRWSQSALGSGTPPPMPQEMTPGTGSLRDYQGMPNTASNASFSGSRLSVNPAVVPGRLSAAPTRQPGTSRKGILIAAATGGVLALGVIGAAAAHMFSSSSTTADAPTPASSVAPPETATVQPSAVASPEQHVEVEIKASPAHATILLEGRPLEGNPVIERLSKSSQTYEVRIEAPGYVSRTMRVSADRSRMLEVELKRERTRSGQLPATQPTEASTVTKTPPVKTSKPDPGLKTDNIDPWSQ